MKPPEGPRGEVMRLNRYLALCGAASRREAMELVFSARVSVNGQLATDPGMEVRCGKDRVTLDGELVQPPQQWVVYAFHKPRGVVVSLDDELGREGLRPFLKRIREAVVPVGRLDRNSEGLLLLTNHGELGHRLLHPRYEVEKVYQVSVTPRPHRGQLERMLAGIEIARGEWGRPAAVRVKRVSRGGAVLRMTMLEGKKREVRRICRATGLRVTRLRRLSFAGILLGDLAPGAHRALTPAERAALGELTGLELS